MVAAVLKNGSRALLFGLMAATLIAAAPSARADNTADNTADKALMEALAKDEQEFRGAMANTPRSTVIGTVARGPNGFYVTSLRPGEDLYSVSGAVSRPSMTNADALAQGESTTQGGQ